MDKIETEVIKLTWAGQETVGAAAEALQRRAKVDIALPASMHHALFCRLNPEADAAEPEEVDIDSGVELIATLSTFDGLETLSALVGPLIRLGYRLHMRSPGPVLYLIPPQMASRFVV